MWEKVGIIRTQKNLNQALSRLLAWEKEFQDIKGVYREFYELKNMITTARLVTEMALKRKKSLGAHHIEETL